MIIGSGTIASDREAGWPGPVPAARTPMLTLRAETVIVAGKRRPQAGKLGDDHRARLAEGRAVGKVVVLRPAAVTPMPYLGPGARSLGPAFGDRRRPVTAGSGSTRR